jgi:hypothetical protein
VDLELSLFEELLHVLVVVAVGVELLMERHLRDVVLGQACCVGGHLGFSSRAPRQQPERQGCRRDGAEHQILGGLTIGDSQDGKAG